MTTRPYREYRLAAFVERKEVDRQVLNLAGHLSSGKSPYTATAKFTVYPDELVLFAKCRFAGEEVEVGENQACLRLNLRRKQSPSRMLSSIRSIWGRSSCPMTGFSCRLRKRQALIWRSISRAGDVPAARASVWFASATANKITSDLLLQKNRRIQVKLALPTLPSNQDRDTLHIAITGEGKEIWHKQIQTMVVTKPPKWPEFGATETKLRFDAPISVRDPRTGVLSSMSYDTAWPAPLKDVVVSLPNGSRYVFWRGSCYIPFGRESITRGCVTSGLRLHRRPMASRIRLNL